MKCLPILFLAISFAYANSNIQEFATANNLFARSVYKEIAKNVSGNLLVSPFSAETALAFATSGCKGDTAEELRKALHLPDDQEKIESAVKFLLPKFKSNGQYTLHTANKLYVKNNYQLHDSFKNVATQVYHADIEGIEFAKNVEAAKIMNDWVEKRTENKIKDLINSNDLDIFTRAVLINALYFKANWSNPFPLASTSKQDFHKSATDVVKVDTLYHYEEYFKYYECPHLKAQFLELPFKGGEASMIIVLPNDKNGLSSLENQLDQVFAPQHQLQTEFLNVQLPKFKIQSSVDFKEVLEKLGVKKAFLEKQADLSGIAGAQGDLFIKKVAQKTFIDVSEEGVEAAAATYIVMAVPTSAIIRPGPKYFIADHPFIFYIKVGDLIILAGRVTDPSG